MEGRDIGKLRKEGYFRGTKANVFKYKFLGITLFVTLGFGFLRVWVLQVIGFITVPTMHCESELGDGKKRICGCPNWVRAMVIDRVKKSLRVRRKVRIWCL